MKFLKFDIESFYPSISMELLKRSLSYAREYIHIGKEEEELILHCRKTVLVGEGGTVWTKENPSFVIVKR